MSLLIAVGLVILSLNLAVVYNRTFLKVKSLVAVAHFPTPERKK